MRALGKIVLWAGILLACAAVGAFIASRSNPFPPGVRDLGTTDDGVSPSPGEDAVAWGFVLLSRTTHTYHVGGSCTSDWRMQTRVQVLPAGRVEGRGVARLLPGARCDFPSAQVQARRVSIRVRGQREGGLLRLRFEELGREPPGSQDLGGFLQTLSRIRLAVPERAGEEAVERTRVREQDETYAAAFRVQVAG